jgi:hypothetical protein
VHSKPWLPDIALDTLAPLVTRALQREGLQLEEWQCRLIYSAIADTTGGVYRFEGTARDRDVAVPWSLILKVVDQSGERAVTDDAVREVLAYESGLLSDLPGGLAAPRLFGITQVSEDTAWLWLEDVSPTIDPVWTPEGYGLAARHIGRFNGAYLLDRELPAYPWLDRAGFRSGIDWSAPYFSRLPAVRNHPLVQRNWPDDLSERILHLWSERDLFLSALQRLPQTLCHNDLIRRNLFSRRTADGHVETVAIDWAQIGIDAIGRDAAQLAPASVHAFLLEPAQLPEVYEIVFDGYLAGLREAGWSGDPGMARLGYTISSALCYALMPLGVVVLDDQQRARYEMTVGHPIEQILDRFAAEQRFLVDRADEAWALMG